MQSKVLLILLLSCNIMKTIEYTLKSDPKKTAIVPANYAREAERFLRFLREEPQRSPDEVAQFPYLRNPGILARSMTLRENPTSLRLEDALYLRVCMYGLEIEGRSEVQERIRIMELGTDLI